MYSKEMCSLALAVAGEARAAVDTQVEGVVHCQQLTDDSTLRASEENLRLQRSCGFDGNTLNPV